MATDIRIDATPNPNAMKFTVTKPLFNGRISHKKGDESDQPLVAQLLSLDGVDNVFGYNDFITINKTFDANWEELLPKIQEAFKEHM